MAAVLRRSAAIHRRLRTGLHPTPLEHRSAAILVKHIKGLSADLPCALNRAWQIRCRASKGLQHDTILRIHEGSVISLIMLVKVFNFLTHCLQFRMSLKVWATKDFTFGKRLVVMLCREVRYLSERGLVSVIAARQCCLHCAVRRVANRNKSCATGENHLSNNQIP